MIHKALKLIRQYHELTVSDLANEFGLTPLYLKELESGNRPIESELLEMYSSKFDIPVTSLVMFSQNIHKEGKLAKKFRQLMVGKVLVIADWAINKNDKKIKA
ncbi:helix-turn-helix domain-containing protein [Xenorhabdus hominickii]|uniref:Transcriptional regulator n=1 Tax=Xenorhabdus hominickii TaxID=351679 RepID=A0A2G0QDA7_XENHO|nr:helix-turn-helix transcriptional regulator [Xenorhabdus hominickii]AOM42878.1 transcriptional regulator [Xenorhabdus hominickii]PHM55431.1 transcriptional regulator [Xenorhabdus hominickii]PHM57204.1 transcriptional regulator [Xenorhabdus hominickii]